MAIINEKIKIFPKKMIRSHRDQVVVRLAPYELDKSIHKALTIKKQKELLEHLKRSGPWAII